MISSQCASAQTPADTQRLSELEKKIYIGVCDEVVVQLQEFTQKYPQSTRVFSLLKSALVCNKQLDSALAVLNYLIKITPDPSMRFTHYLDIASIYLKKGETDRASKQLEVALAVQPTNPQTYEQASNVYTGNGYYADAVKILLDGRKRLGNPTLFARQLGLIYEIMRNYGDAVQEYYDWLAKDTTAEVYVAGRINDLIKLDSDESFDTGLKKTLTEIVDKSPKEPHAQRFFGDLLQSQGKLDDAFQRFRLADSLSNGQGREVQYFAAVALNNGDYSVAESACQYLIARYPQSPFLLTSMFTLALAYGEQARYEDAISVYNQIIAKSPSERDKATAQFSIGRIRLLGLHDPAGALTQFEGLVKGNPVFSTPTMSKIAIADCHLALGHASRAESLYAAIVPQQMQQSLQEELLFKQAELQFFLGNFEAAREAYGKTMNTYPKSIYVNDCLRRVMLISEYPGMDEATLRVYAEAAYAQFRFDYDSALVLLNKLKTQEAGSLTEIAWYDVAAIERQLGRPAQALAQFDTLATNFPESFYAPLAMEAKGDILADVDHNCTGARATYQAVLLTYPKCLNLEAVRRKLQRVERVLCNSSEKPKS